MAQVSPAIGLEVVKLETNCSWDSSPSTPGDCLEVSTSPGYDDPFSVDVEPSQRRASFELLSPRSNCEYSESGHVTAPVYKAAHSTVLTTSDFEETVGSTKQADEAASAPEDNFRSSLSSQPLTPANGIILTLEGADLWHQFFQAGTEMIITKSGRRMFPGIAVSVEGLNPDNKYVISLEVKSADPHRYKYINTKWMVVSKGDSHNDEHLKYIHPDSPASGKHWMANKIAFKKIKVTNNKNNKRGNVTLNSMHRYLPSVVISKCSSKKESNVIFTQDLDECSFIAVTAYQNDQVTQLKIDHNPFAKAFREGSSDQEMYSYSTPSWPPVSPALPPYSQAFGSGGHSPMQPGLPSPLPGHSPLPQFASVFGNWESPPYSPIPPYRPYLPNTNLGPLPSPLPDHRHITWNTSRLQQESPPISPLLYSPNMYTQQHSSIYQFPGAVDPSIHGHLLKSPSTTSASASNFQHWPLGNGTRSSYMSESPVGYGFAANKTVLSHQPQYSTFNVPRLEDINIHSPTSPHDMMDNN